MEALLLGGLRTGVLFRGLAAARRTLALPGSLGAAALTPRRPAYSSTSLSPDQLLHRSVLPTMLFQESLPR